METLQLTSDNIEGESFQQLMRDCFACSDLFSMTRFGGNAKPQVLPGERQATKRRAQLAEWEKLQDQILEVLAPFRVGTIESNHWFYIWTVPPLYVDLYQTSEEARDTLLSIFDNLYLDAPFHGFEDQVGFCPADLCFFQKGSCWFGCCSHESICYAQPMSAGMAVSLRQAGAWRPDPDGNGADWLVQTSVFLADYLAGQAEA